MTLVTRIWSIIIINMLIFNNEIIYTISWSDFIWTSLSNPWANTILPFLAIVLFFSFIKQIFNYIFVAHDKQNKLFWINLFGVIVGLSAWLYLIPNYQIMWWIITQVWLELLFVWWALYVAAKYKLLPKINRKKMLTLLWISAIIWWTGFYILNYVLYTDYTNFWYFVLAWLAINIPIILLSLPIIKKIAKWLTKND